MAGCSLQGRIAGPEQKCHFALHVLQGAAPLPATQPSIPSPPLPHLHFCNPLPSEMVGTNQTLKACTCRAAPPDSGGTAAQPPVSSMFWNRPLRRLISYSSIQRLCCSKAGHHSGHSATGARSGPGLSAECRRCPPRSTPQATRYDLRAAAAPQALPSARAPELPEITLSFNHHGV